MRNLITKLSALSAAAVLMMSLSGCAANVTGVTLTLPATIERGTTMMATPEYAFDGETPETATYEKKIDALGMEYTSSNPDVIAVDENGNLTALSIGTAEVAMQSRDGKIADSKTMEVVVTPTDMQMADSLTLTESNNKAQLDVVVTPDDATHVAVAYATSDESVATVNADGEVEAKAVGEATITAAIVGTELSRECYVTVLPDVQEVTLSDTSLSIQKGGTAALTYGILPEEAVDTGAVYTSADESIATVAEDGTVTAVANGKTTITVTVAGVSADCAVTVYTPAPKASTASASGGSSSAAAGSADQSSSQSSTAAASGFEYGAIPFSMANDGCWWYIDQSDSAYWAVLNNINAMRAAAGVAPLSANSGLDAIATSRCDYQLVNNTLSHDGAQTPEILAQSQKSASEVCYAWQTSPSHYAVITNPSFTQIGIGCYFEIGGSTIWCCTFG